MALKSNQKAVAYVILWGKKLLNFLLLFSFLHVTSVEELNYSPENKGSVLDK